MNNKTKLLIGLIFANILAYLWWGKFQPSLNVMFSLITLLVFGFLTISNRIKHKRSISNNNKQLSPRLPNVYFFITLIILHLPILFFYLNADYFSEAIGIFFLGGIFYYILWISLGIALLFYVMEYVSYLLKRKND